MPERTGATTMRGNPLTLMGTELKPGDAAPDFNVVDVALKPVTLQDTGNHVRIISVTPSHQSPTGVAMSLRRRAALLDFAREINFKGILAHQGDSALSLARDYLPSAILLDLDMSDIDGFTVLERLKRDPSTRHIQRRQRR